MSEPSKAERLCQLIVSHVGLLPKRALVASAGDADLEGALLAAGVREVQRGEVDEALADSLCRQEGSQVELIVIRSAAPRSLRPQVAQLNRLAPDQPQWLVWLDAEEEEGRSERQSALGVESWASLPVAEGRAWIGRRHTSQHLRELSALIDAASDLAELRASGVYVSYQKRQKVCIRWGSAFVKTVLDAETPFNALLENELRVAQKLRSASARVPILIDAQKIDGRVFLSYEDVGRECLGENFVPVRSLPWIRSELEAFVDDLERLGVAHHDLRMENVLLVSATKELRVIDYEFGDCRGFNAKPPGADTYYPFATDRPEVRALLDDLMPRVNRVLLDGPDGSTGDAFGLGWRDREAAYATLQWLEDRPRYWRRYLGRRLMRAYQALLLSLARAAKRAMARS